MYFTCLNLLVQLQVGGNLNQIRDAPLDIWGGGELGEIWKQNCGYKSRKKVSWKYGQKKKRFVDGIDEKYVDHNKPANIQNWIGKAYDKIQYFRSSTKHKKSSSEIHRQKIIIFLYR